MRMQVLIVSTPTVLPVVVLRVGQTFIAALGRLRKGLAPDVCLKLLGWYGAKAQLPAGFICFTKHLIEDQISRAQGNTVLDSADYKA